MKDDEQEDTETSDPKGLSGTVLCNKYRVYNYLGGGGFGEVYLARNIQMPEQRVVIKFLKLVDARGRFKDEAKFLCGLDHPNICRIIDYYPTEGALVMQYIEGVDCAQLLEKEGLLGDQTILSIARGVTSALKYTHSLHIAHRDIKPKNLMLDQHGHVYVIDFGIAKATESTGLTGTGRPPYTPQFAAPERHLQNKPYNPYLSDIYEVGATLLKLATGSSPFEEQQLAGSRRGKQNSRRRLSRSFSRMLKKATEPFPEDRYQRMSELESEIGLIKRVYRPSRRVAYVVTLTLLVGLLTLGYFKRSEVLRVSDLVAHWAGRTVIDLTSTESTSPIVQSPEVDTASRIVDTPKTQDTQSSPSVIPEVKPSSSPADVPPPIHQLTLDVTPKYGTTLMVDLVARDINETITLKPGRHELVLRNPRFPILVDTIDMASDRSRRYDLVTEAAGRVALPLFIGSCQPLGDVCLRITLNGATTRHCQVPIYDLSVLRGLWSLRINAIGPDASVDMFDSVVTFPYGGGPRSTFLAGDSLIDLDNLIYRDIPRLDMVVFWSSKRDQN